MVSGSAFAAAMCLAALCGHAMAASAHDLRCLEVRAPLAAGAIPLSQQFAPADCPAASVQVAFHYDRATGATTLARPLAAGEIVPVYPEYGAAMVHPGEMLKLVVATGAVRIERQVEAMQPARPGQRLFVKSADGQILSVRYEEVRP
jgi:hypothetical protein